MNEEWKDMSSKLFTKYKLRNTLFSAHRGEEIKRRNWRVEAIH